MYIWALFYYYNVDINIVYNDIKDGGFWHYLVVWLVSLEGSPSIGTRLKDQKTELKPDKWNPIK